MFEQMPDFELGKWENDHQPCWSLETFNEQWPLQLIGESQGLYHLLWVDNTNSNNKNNNI